MTLLGLNEQEVLDVEHRIFDFNSHYYVTFKKVHKPCPYCKTLTQKTNGSQTVTIRHPIFSDRLCFVHLKKYRYICPVCRKTFMVKTPLAPSHKTYSYALINLILEETKYSNITFSYLANKTGFSITKLIDILSKIVQLIKSISLEFYVLMKSI